MSKYVVKFSKIHIQLAKIPLMGYDIKHDTILIKMFFVIQIVFPANNIVIISFTKLKFGNVM